MLPTELNAIKLKREMEQMLSKNAVNMKRLNEILLKLNTMDMDLEVLRKTKIGVCVNSVRKTFKNSKEIAKSTADLIRKWKKIAKEEFRSKSEECGEESYIISGNNIPNINIIRPSLPSAIGLPISSSVKLEISEIPVDDHSYTYYTENSNSSSNLLEKVDRRKQQFQPKSNDEEEIDNFDKNKSKSRPIPSSNKVPKNQLREKSVDLLMEALQTDQNGDTKLKNSDQFVRIAVEIEKFIFRENPDPSDKKYKAKVRSRVMNLRDKNNPDFRRNVLRGYISPDEAASMSVEEMASSQLKKLRKSIEEETMKERELQDSSATLGKSTMFMCPECEGRDTSYNISQDRLEGEYEPVAVTSIFCNKCGHRWKSF